jgi:hypothetical protein
VWPLPACLCPQACPLAPQQRALRSSERICGNILCKQGRQTTKMGSAPSSLPTGSSTEGTALFSADLRQQQGAELFSPVTGLSPDDLQRFLWQQTRQPLQQHRAGCNQTDGLPMKRNSTTVTVSPLAHVVTTTNAPVTSGALPGSSFSQNISRWLEALPGTTASCWVCPTTNKHQIALKQAYNKNYLSNIECVLPSPRCHYHKSICHQR